MRIFRIGDERHALWSGVGAALVGGRWNTPGREVIYGSLSYACAMLEILAHAAIGRVPRTHAFIAVEVPPEVSVERPVPEALPPGWDAEDSVPARLFGDRWLVECRSAVLIVPSVVARLDWNALVNPRHPDFKRLVPGAPRRVIWDRRLFERDAGA